jgi:excisionase family DNA binding protein
MKNDKLSPAYFSTSEVAKVLGLSVGTVQRMVETGVFKAFVTQGGHRRILSSSLDQFCQAQGFASPQAPHAPPLVCILHPSDHMTGALAQLSQWGDVRVITQPLDLMGMRQDIEALFIDARIGWVHESALHLKGTSAQDARIVVYNSAHLPASSALHAAAHMLSVPGDISTDLVFGYLMGSADRHPLSIATRPVSSFGKAVTEPSTKTERRPLGFSAS